MKQSVAAWVVTAVFWGCSSDDPATAAGAGTPDAGPSTTTTTDGDGGTPIVPPSGVVDTPISSCGAGTGEWKLIDPNLAELKVSLNAPPLDPVTRGFLSVAFGAGMFLAMPVIYKKPITWATSPDGETWTMHTAPLDGAATLANVGPVHFVGGKFVFFGTEMGGDGGAYTYSSADGATWAKTKVALQQSVVEFAVNGTTTVAVGENSDMEVTTDGSHWAPQTVAGGSYNDVAFGNGRFVATSNAGGKVYTSADGLKWDPIAGIDATPSTSVEFGNGVFIVSGGPAIGPGPYTTSTDGVTFAKATPTGPSAGAGPYFLADRFLRYRNNYTSEIWFTASKDGIVWTDFANHVPLPGASTTGGVVLAYGNCRYVGVGTRTVDNVTQPYVITTSVGPAP